jgi:hypothetical protein
MRFSNFKGNVSFPALAVSLSCFAIANIISYFKMDWNHVFATDMEIHCGFPFSFYYFSGWGIGYIWSGIVADVIVATVTSLVVGVIWPSIRHRSQTPR